MSEHDDGARDGRASRAPDGIPVLSAGRHRGPERGSCVMEYASVLAGEAWSDHPRCTDRALSELARIVNDDIRAQARSALAELAPRLVGAVGRDGAADVVVAAVTRVTLELAPGDPLSARLRRRALDRLHRRMRPPRLVRLVRTLSGGGVPEAYTQLRRVTQDLDRSERDEVRILALRTATEEVRRHVGAPEAPRPTAATRPVPVPRS